MSNDQLHKRSREMINLLLSAINYDNLRKFHTEFSTLAQKIDVAMENGENYKYLNLRGQYDMIHKLVAQETGYCGLQMSISRQNSSAPRSYSPKATEPKSDSPKATAPDVTIEWLKEEIEIMRKAAKDLANRIEDISTCRRLSDDQEVSLREYSPGNYSDKFEIKMDKLINFQKFKSEGNKLMRKIAEEIIPKTDKLPNSSEVLHCIYKLKSYKTELELICIHKNAWSVHTCKTFE